MGPLKYIFTSRFLWSYDGTYRTLHRDPWPCWAVEFKVYIIILRVHYYLALIKWEAGRQHVALVTRLCIVDFETYTALFAIALFKKTRNSRKREIYLSSISHKNKLILLIFKIYTYHRNKSRLKSEFKYTSLVI